MKMKKLLFLVLLFLSNITIYAQYCTTGCNGNSYIYSSDPNTIEYDNMISTFHASLAKEKDGSFKVWGQASASNGTGDLYAPTLIAPTNGFNYTGTALRVAGGSNSNAGHQFALLTTDGLYVWGTTNYLISSAIKSNAAFGKISVNGKTDGLPAGVSPSDVKMMFGSYRTLAIVTCTGDAWVLSFIGAKNGDGTTEDATNNVIWHRVKTSATVNLNNVVAMRGTPNALFALTSNGNLYTWGTNTYLGDNSSSSNRTFATQISTSVANGIPINTIPKMIGMTQAGGSANLQSYYLLATNGRLYAMGDNSNRQLGDGSITASNVWKEVTATSTINSTTYNLGGNIAWISPNEHSNYANTATINVLTNNGKQWAWGANSGNMIGQASTTTYYDPIYMPGSSTANDGLSLTDEVVAVETGGHTTINIKKCSQNFGYVGHKTNGSMGDGTSGTGNPTSFTYSTSILVVCGADAGPRVKEIKICDGTTADLNNANLEGNPTEVEWHATNDATSPVITNITAVGPGTYYAFYTAASGKCRLVGSVVIISNYLPTDPSNPCYCYKSATTTGGVVLDTNVGITALNRAGASGDNWPMARKGGWIALESKTKAFVPNRVAFSGGNPVGIAPVNFVEGMMVYDTTNKCMKLYTLKAGDTQMAWHCMTTQTCPDITTTPIISRKVNIGYWGTGFNFYNDNPNFKSQLENTANYGATGIFKGVSGWTWLDANTDINSGATTFSAIQLKAKYDMIVTGFSAMSTESAQKIKEYTDLGGVVIVLMDVADTGQFQNLAFGGSGNITVPSGPKTKTNPQARTLNNAISNGVFGDARGIEISGTAGSAIPSVGNIPAGSLIISYMNYSSYNPDVNESGVYDNTATKYAGVYIIGTQGRAIFVYDEGIFRNPTNVTGNTIDTNQEKFIHNLMSYALQKIGFSPQ